MLGPRRSQIGLAIIIACAVFGAAGTARAAGSVLSPGAELDTGQSVVSPNGDYRLTMQGDGNLVEYGSDNVAIWASGTRATGSRAVMQGDGNLVVYNKNDVALWATGTDGNPGATLSLDDTGETDVLSPSGHRLWGVPGILGSWTILINGLSLTSANGLYRLTMQGDGNLVEYSVPLGDRIWSTGTSGARVFAAMQGDGNLVVYDVVSRSSVRDRGRAAQGRP